MGWVHTHSSTIGTVRLSTIFFGEAWMTAILGSLIWQEAMFGFFQEHCRHLRYK